MSTINNEKNNEKINILVLERSDSSRMNIVEILKKWQFSFEVANNSEMAMTLLLRSLQVKKPYTVLLIADNLDEMKGTDFIKKLKTERNYETIFSILMTSNLESLVNHEEKEVEAILKRPLQESLLYDCLVQSLIKMKKQGRDSILLVEDNKIMQMVGQKILEKSGHRVILADDGKQALEILKEDAMSGSDNIKLVFMDVQMPNLNGLEATQQIRNSNLKNRNIPIVAMTASSEEANREICASVGMTDFVPKPIDLNQVKSLLNKYLGEQKNEQMSIDQDLFNGDQEVFLAVAKAFIEHAPTYSMDLKNAIKNLDFSLGERVAHSVKGLGQTFGSDEISNEAIKLEKKFQARLATGYEESFVILEKYLLEMSEQLRKTIDKKS